MGSTGLLESTHAVGRESRNLLGSLLFRSLLRVAVCPSVGIPKQRDRSSRRPSIDLLLVELVEGKACLSTKAEPRRCWSTCPLSAEQSSVPDVIRREQLDHCASFGDWASSSTTSEGASPGSKGQRPKQIQWPGVDLDHETLKFLGAAGDPKDSGGYKRHGGKNGDQRASGVGKRPAAGESCDHVRAVTE